MSENNHEPPRNYEVGYGKPPKKSQFKKGESGNANGRRAEIPSIEELLDRELRRKVTITENGKTKRVTKWEVINLRLISKAMTGDLQAIKLVKALRKRSDDPGATDDELTLTDKEILAAYLKMMEEGDFGEEDEV